MNHALDDYVRIITPENVAFRFRLADLGSRFIALFVDMLVQLVLFTVTATIIFIAGAGVAALANIVLQGADTISSSIMNIAVSMIVVSLFLVEWGYFVFFEVRSGGQTPGKRLMKLRVVRDQGQPVRFFDSVIRNILRIVDLLPPLYLVGLISVLASKQNKRIGDLAAGTIVVRETPSAAPAAAPTGGLDSETTALIGDYLARRTRLVPEGRLEVARALARAADVDADGDETALTSRLESLLTTS